MRKTLLAATSIIVILSVPSAFAHHPDKVDIKAAAKKQTAVPFNHMKHVKLAKSCDTCHHTNKGLTAETKAKVEKCSTCHLDPKPNVPGMREVSLTKNPFHMGCIACHKTQKKGPVACAGCHVKKS